MQREIIAAYYNIVRSRQLILSCQRHERVRPVKDSQNFEMISSVFSAFINTISYHICNIYFCNFADFKSFYKNIKDSVHQVKTLLVLV